MKNENLVKLPLDEILKNNGYFEKREKSSQRYKTLTNDNADTIIISKQGNGDYLYFNPNNNTDKGNIYNFTKNRGISAKDLIDDNKISDIKELQKNTKNTAATNNFNNEIIEKFKNLDKIGKNSFLIIKRKLSSELLANFSTLKQDEKFKNAVVPTYTLNILYTNNGDKEFLRQTGTISYLSQPIVRDPQGKPYEKPIKQLCNGNKGLEILKADTAHKNPREFKNIIVCESMIDTLSLCEIKGYILQETLLCSTNGQISQSQKTALQTLHKLAPNAKFVLGFDNDEKGKEFAVTVEKTLGSKNVNRITPTLKDFNDDLIVGKTLGIKPCNINKESILKPIKAFHDKVGVLYKKYDLLQSHAKNERVKVLFAMDINKFKGIAPKISTIRGTRDCFKRLSLLEKKIERDFSRTM